MQYKQRHSKVLKGLLKTLCFLSFFLPILAFSQTTYLPQGAKENILLERLEIKAGTDSILNFSKTKPFSRKQVVPVIESAFRTGLVWRGSDSVASTTELPKPLD